MTSISDNVGRAGVPGYVSNTCTDNTGGRRLTGGNRTYTLLAFEQPSEITD